MHFSTLIAALMLPLAVLAAPIARAEVDAVNQAINLFRSGVESTLAALDKVHDTASSIVSGQEAALASQANSARQFVTSAKTSVDFGFSPETEPHTPDETYVEAYSLLLVRILTSVFDLPANSGARRAYSPPNV